MPTTEEPAPASDQYLDAKAVAARLNLPINTVYRLIETGKLPALRFPVRIRASDLDGLLDRCRIRPGEMGHLNQYSGRPKTQVAEWYRSKARSRQRPRPGDKRSV